MGIFTWIIFGLIVGMLAKVIMPGKDGGGFIFTTLLGISGAFVGGFVGSFIGFGSVDEFSLGSMATAIVGALILLFVYRRIKS